MIRTGEFTTTSGQYLSALLGLWLPRYWVMPVVPVLVCVALGLWLDDWRWLLVGLMLIFIVIPMAMSFLYTYYMLTPEARRAVTPKRVEIEAGSHITLLYVPEEMAPERIDKAAIRSVRYRREYLMYELATPRLQFVMIPYSALPAGVSRQALSM